MNATTSIAILFTAIAAGMFALYIQSKPTAAIDRYLQERNFSGTMLIGHGNDILFTHAYGMANLDIKFPTPFTLFIALDR